MHSQPVVERRNTSSSSISRMGGFECNLSLVVEAES